MSEEKKVFGRFHDLILLMIGTFLGGLFTHSLDLANWQKQHNQIALENERAKAESFCKSLSQCMDTRMLAMRAVLRAYDNGWSRERTKKQWSEYNQVLEDWNANLSSNVWQIERYFGPEHRLAFETGIHGQFRKIGIRLEDLGWGRAKPTRARIKSTKSNLDALDNRCHNFNDGLLKATLKGNIGVFRTDALQAKS